MLSIRVRVKGEWGEEKQRSTKQLQGTERCCSWALSQRVLITPFVYIGTGCPTFSCILGLCCAISCFIRYVSAREQIYVLLLFYIQYTSHSSFIWHHSLVPLAHSNSLSSLSPNLFFPYDNSILFLLESSYSSIYFAIKTQSTSYILHVINNYNNRLERDRTIESGRQAL